MTGIQYNVIQGVTYLVVGSTGATVTYNGTTYAVGDTFTGVSGVTTYTSTSGEDGYVESDYVEADYVATGSGYAGIISTIVTEFDGVSLEFGLHADEIQLYTQYEEVTQFKSISLELGLQADEIYSAERTVLKSVSLELAYDQLTIQIY